MGTCIKRNEPMGDREWDKQAWVSRCADRYVEQSKCDRDLAESMAEASLENLAGDLTEDPIEAADEDMSCWSE